jgi:Hemerythrin HHE cation binding domain
MRRSVALAPLSRDHHVALVVAMSLSRADRASAAAAAERFASFIADHELAHFALEESILLPALPPDQRELAQRVRDDHIFLREACARVRSEPHDVGLLHEVGTRLRAHVQMEERELFPYLEQSLTAEELDRLGSQLAQASA